MLSPGAAAKVAREFTRENRLNLNDEELESIIYWLSSLQEFLYHYPEIISLSSTVQEFQLIKFARDKEKQ